MRTVLLLMLTVLISLTACEEKHKTYIRYNGILFTVSEQVLDNTTLLYPPYTLINIPIQDTLRVIDTFYTEGYRRVLDFEVCSIYREEDSVGIYDIKKTTMLCLNGKLRKYGDMENIYSTLAGDWGFNDMDTGLFVLYPVVPCSAIVETLTCFIKKDCEE